MDKNYLDWEQIKELAKMASDNNNDFNLCISKDGDIDISISEPSSAPIYRIPLIKHGFH